MILLPGVGNPELRLALNEDLVVGKSNAGANFGAVVLDVSCRGILQKLIIRPFVITGRRAAEDWPRVGRGGWSQRRVRVGEQAGQKPDKEQRREPSV